MWLVDLGVSVTTTFFRSIPLGMHPANPSALPEGAEHKRLASMPKVRIAAVIGAIIQDHE